MSRYQAAEVLKAQRVLSQERTEHVAGRLWEVADRAVDAGARRLAGLQVEGHQMQTRHVVRRAEMGGADVELELQ